MANFLRYRCLPRFAAAALCHCLLAVLVCQPVFGSELRRTAEVRAIEQVRPCVVNIHGHKTVPGEPGAGGVSEAARRVNGMGTGLVIDERGYVLTNFHVVEGVSRIQVTMYDGRTYIARLVAKDRASDLAVIKIPVSEHLQLPKIGTSSDLMLGEPVIAVGNAFGYENTVTRGIISGLNRPVEVTETQSYDDLIQTDASINPGNSGGPLLNIDGDVIGINVAVRVGAQGIAFAIPIDKAMSVASQLLTAELIENLWHGIEGETEISQHHSQFVVRGMRANSPADKSGLQAGDVITAVAGLPIERTLDLERAFIGRDSGDEVEVSVDRGGERLTLELVLANRRAGVASSAGSTWEVLGLRLTAIPPEQFQRISTSYRGGLRVTAVRPGSPAAEQGIRRGDALVGMHLWETVTMENVRYVLNHPDFESFNPVKFYIVRSGETLFGHLPVASARR